MKIYLVIASGRYTMTINGEKCTADKIAILKASSDHEEVKKLMEGAGPTLPDAENWGLTAISVYSTELDDAPCPI